uniref:Phosphate transporter n=1 Tax=Culicoides sonorensis TaxID=179676 RepID=A0A336K9H5_CULSO
MEAMLDSVLWIVIVGFIIAFILAFGIGANDVANSFGTSVGSGVLTIRQACWLATFCEVSGAVLIGYKVSDTMRKGILDTSLYNGHESELMLGCLAALGSRTHSIVGSTIGYSLVARGTAGLQWSKLGTIVGSWFVSPVLSGLVSVGLFWMIQNLILNAKNPFGAGLVALPIFYGVTVFINVFSIVNDGPKLLHMDNIPLYIAIVVSLGIALVIAVLVQAVVVPWQKRKILGVDRKGKAKFTFGDSDDSSNNGSPRQRHKRPVSVVCDGKQLPAITETTELVSFNNGCCSPKHIQTNPNGLSKNTQSSLSHKSNLSNNNSSSTGTSTTNNTSSIYSTTNNNGNSYKFDPKIVKHAEYLLGKHSLDNTDVTITSLNYIDEYQNTINNSNAITGIRTIQGYFDRKNSIKSPEIKGTMIVNDQTPRACLASPIPSLEEAPPHTTDLIIGPSIIIEDEFLPTKKDLTQIDSAASLDGMVNQSLLPNNSSKVPLIASKDNLLAQKKRKGEETEEVSKLFAFLQIMTAAFGSFAHGGNDVSNAIGPLIALYMIYKDGNVAQKAETPLSILLFGGAGISIGLWIWGRRVIKTVGNDLTKITPSTGFTIEIGAALTVLLASKIGLPISTTHCKVGSVVFVGYTSSGGSKDDLEGGNNNEQARRGVDWGLFRNIVYAWIVTIPVAALLSAGLMFILQRCVL